MACVGAVEVSEVVHSWVQRMVRKETTLAALVPMPLLDQTKRSCEQWELGHHTTPVSQGLIKVVEEKILQCGVWNAAAVAVAAAVADADVDGDAPSLVGLVVQYVLGLSPVRTQQPLLKMTVALVQH